MTTTLLGKPIKSAIGYMSEALFQSPYEGAKEMSAADDVDNKAFLS